MNLVASADYRVKLGTVMASDDLPDLMHIGYEMAPRQVWRISSKPSAPISRRIWREAASKIIRTSPASRSIPGTLLQASRNLGAALGQLTSVLAAVHGLGAVDEDVLDADRQSAGVGGGWRGWRAH